MKGMVYIKKFFKIFGVATAIGTALIAGKILYHGGYDKGYNKALRDNDEIGDYSV
ncbi:MAG: hypothetical protein ACI4JN_02515 [Ruminococcus sp.]